MLDEFDILTDLYRGSCIFRVSFEALYTPALMTDEQGNTILWYLSTVELLHKRMAE